MCGIIGLLGREGVAPRLVEGLARLKYRGCDSAVGKLDRLWAVLDGAMPKGRVGLGHTRWATHGAATEPSAHSHQVGSATLVHNAIMENHAALCEKLMAQGANSDLRMPPDGPLAASFANAGVAQLLAYDVALEKSTEVDQPRNLAKSVTVE